MYFYHYQIIEKISSTPRITVYRAKRLADGLSVILKTLSMTNPSLSDIARLKQEYNLLKMLHEIPGVIKAFDFFKQDNTYAIVLEEVAHAQNLKEIIQSGRMDIATMLTISIQLADILQALHKAHVIHKDINPSNILVFKRQVKIIDFSMAALLSQEVTKEEEDKIEGTLQYISPEQTGRMNRSVDYRTDFYSLGVTFYEMLTGKLPFQATDALGWVHAHIAKKPRAPSETNAHIPLPLSAIVMKLLAKAQENRYQTAYGLKEDLEYCLDNWQRTQSIPDFPLAQHDETEILQISQKLYGRENEINTLLNTFAKTAEGEQAILLVSGYVGIGKSALINEIQKNIVEKRALFSVSKFEQFKHDVPYSAQPFRQLIKQILSGTPEDMAKWRKQIGEVLYPNAQLIIDVIPELEWLIGKQPAVPELPPKEAQGRFEIVFTDFVGIFATAKHPLVICLDDLQWADLATLSLIKHLLSSKVLNYFLLIGTYRENEVSPGHRLLDTMAEIEKSGVTVHHLSLAPLNLDNVYELLCDTLHSQLPLHDLAELVLEKTAGSPFFINFLLTHFYQQHLLSYDHQQNGWTWDIEYLRKMSITDNVVDLLVKKIEKLPQENKQILQLAACIGSVFDLNLLSLVCKKPPQQTANYLWLLLQEKLIIPIGENYKLAMADENFAASDLSIQYQFAHDRVQQAAYSTLTATQKKHISLEIGRLFLMNNAPAIVEEKLFEVVNYFNRGLELLADDVEKLRVAELNMKAAYKAKTAIAYSAAERYFQQALTLLGRNSWEEHYDLAFNINMGLAECLHLLGRFAEANAVFADINRHTYSKLDKAKIHLLMTLSFTLQARYQEAVEEGLNGLTILELKLPKHPHQWHVLLELLKVKWLLRNKNAEFFLSLPAATDPEKKLIVEFLDKMRIAAYATNINLFTLLFLKHISYCLKYGYFPASPTLLEIYAISLVAIGQFKQAYNLSQVAAKMAESIDDLRTQGVVQISLGSVFLPCKVPYIECIAPILEGCQKCLHYGELLHAGYAASLASAISFFAGEELTELAKRVKKMLEILKITHSIDGMASVIVLSHIIDALTHEQQEEQQAYSLFAKFVNDYIGKFTNFSQAYFYKLFGTLSLVCAYLFEDPILTKKMVNLLSHAAIKNLREVGFFSDKEYHLYLPLALVGLYPQATNKEKRYYRKKIYCHLKKLQKIAKLYPINYQAQYHLLAAAYALIENQLDSAITNYKQAINYASQNGFIYLEAIAHELIGRWFFERQQPMSAKGYLEQAVYAYQQWGATAKVSALLAKYSNILAHTISLTHEPISASISYSKSISASHSDTIKLLDLVAIMKSSQAISSHLNLKDLLVGLLKAMIEASGAERCVLLLMRNHQLFVESIGQANHRLSALLVHQRLENYKDICLGIVRYVENTKQTVVLDNAYKHSEYKDDAYIKQNKPLSILCLPILHQRNLMGILYLENNLVSYAFTQKHVEISQLLASQAAISLEIAQLHQAYDQFVPHQFLDLLDKRSILDVSLGDYTNKKMAILFSDIRGFTHLSEQLSPDDIFHFMNEYLSYMEPIIIEHGGFIDKYIGDAIMALFPQDVDKALKAAIAMKKQLTLINSQRANENKPSIRIGIGINYGNLILCTFGGIHRIETSVLGDTVNLASRLEHLTKEYDSPLLISDAVYQNLADPSKYHCRFAGLIKLAGKAQETGIWEIYDSDPEELRNTKLAIAKWYERGLDLFAKKDYEPALGFFQRCLKKLPNDKFILKFISECQYHLSLNELQSTNKPFL